ncbi:MAG: hypothetical protein AAB482_01105 [Patescibacteria group bacterium]
MNQKGFAPIIIVLVIVAAAALGGGAWHYNSTKIKATAENQVIPPPTPIVQPPAPPKTNPPPPSTNSTWKTYKNVKYGFQLEYPADWGDARPISATLPSDMLVSDFIVAFEIEQGRIARGYSFEISLINNLKNETFADIKAEMTKVVGTRGTVHVVNMGGKEMLQFTNANPGEYAVALGYTILTPDQKAILNVAFSGEQKPSAEISNRIISSLKFTSQ